MFKYIPLKDGNPCKSKIKNKRLHLKTLKCLTVLGFAFTKNYEKRNLT